MKITIACECGNKVTVSGPSGSVQMFNLNFSPKLTVARRIPFPSDDDLISRPKCSIDITGFASYNVDRAANTSFDLFLFYIRR